MPVSSRSWILAALFAAVSLALGAAAPSTAQAASTRIVDDDYGTPAACHGAGYATIQDAVDTFAAGQSGTIRVCPGTYPESVSISGLGRIRITGMPGATITGMTSPPMIQAIGTTLLTVRGLTLDGAALTLPSFKGMIYIEGGSAVITKNRIRNGSGYWGISTLLSGPSSLKVIRNTFDAVGGCLETNIGSGTLMLQVVRNNATNSGGVKIAAGSGATTKAKVSGNHLQGADTGVDVVGDVRGSMSGNSVDGGGVGVTLSIVSGFRVVHNRIRSSQYGVYIDSGVFSASSNRVQRNSLEASADNFVGVFIQAFSGSADLNQIKGNTIANPGGAFTGTTGVRLTLSAGSLDGTLIAGNRLINIGTPLDASGDTNTQIKGNKCSPALPCFP